MRIDPPMSPNWFKNFHDSREHDPCIVCGKEVPNVRHEVIQDITTNELISPDDADAGSEDAIVVPVGPDCLRKNPELKPYLI